MDAQRLTDKENYAGTERWDIVKSESHWLTLREAGWYWADVKWDGCIHLRRYFNNPVPLGAIRPPEDDDDRTSDYFHICDLDEEIARLQRLRAAAIAHFGEDWAAQ